MSESRPVALVTGAGRGIGYGIAKRLAGDGCDVAICDIHEEQAVRDALKGIEDLGGKVLYCRADVSDAKARRDMLDEIEAKFNRLDILVNNAGVAPKVRADILEATEESFDWVLGINLKGPYFLTQAVANWMIRQKRADDAFAGRIVNISSISATVASPSRGEYCISKAGVSMATRLWAARLGEFGIGVFEVRPGVIMTDMTATVKDKYDKLFAEGMAVQARWGQVEDVAKAVAMLARGELAYSTGQVVMVDGGMSLQ
ncbi:MAG: 3-ketoacyl-ACP reductase, partial [Planctomycetes bacterium]|nr:3-ketoacyl-ACP reductase [Planctomycetota bacterium]